MSLSPSLQLIQSDPRFRQSCTSQSVQRILAPACSPTDYYDSTQPCSQREKRWGGESETRGAERRLNLPLLLSEERSALSCLQWTDRKEQLSGGMCEGGGDGNKRLTVKEGWITFSAPVSSCQGRLKPTLLGSGGFSDHDHPHDFRWDSWWTKGCSQRESKPLLFWWIWSDLTSVRSDYMTHNLPLGIFKMLRCLWCLLLCGTTEEETSGSVEMLFIAISRKAWTIHWKCPFSSLQWLLSLL